MGKKGATSSKGKEKVVASEDEKKVRELCNYCHKVLSLTQADLNDHMAACKEKDEARKAEEARKKAEIEAKLQRQN